jgi:hypothetical protein
LTSGKPCLVRGQSGHGIYQFIGIVFKVRVTSIEDVWNRKKILPLSPFVSLSPSGTELVLIKTQPDVLF